MACKAGKPNGNMVWHPQDMPAPLLPLVLAGYSRHWRAGCICGCLQARIASVDELLATQPKQLRALWGNVTGERMWYALHGYDIQAEPQERGMYGHGRVLPPEARASERCPCRYAGCFW